MKAACQGLGSLRCSCRRSLLVFEVGFVLCTSHFVIDSRNVQLSDCFSACIKVVCVQQLAMPMQAFACHVTPTLCWLCRAGHSYMVCPKLKWSPIALSESRFLQPSRSQYTVLHTHCGTANLTLCKSSPLLLRHKQPNGHQHPAVLCNPQCAVHLTCQWCSLMKGWEPSSRT